ncbi:MAG: phosphohistidine phosphatase SixA [Ignavibacteria bacterium CG_4_9_14_3_um_filter_36_18]|nr:MAG: phosphohistidine phosphatase SixA [Ignavibacteria bacterium CG_4_9_14_3_um_filter_36_18]
MNIYIVRHGDAEKSSLSKKDSQRELTIKGKVNLNKAANGWKNLISHVDHIVSSPYLRAKQTAEIIARNLGFEGNIILNEKLKSGSSTEDLVMLANSLSGEDIIFIGHEPDCSEHLSKLISSSEIFVNFQKGMIAKVSFNNRVRKGKGMLEFVIPVKLFDK